MKVKLFDGKVWNMAIGIIAVLAGIVSFLMGFNLIEDVNVKKYVLLGFCVLSIVIYVAVLIYANSMNSKKIKIRQTTINIKYGDIYNENGRKIIEFNEYFDTQVDDVIIAKKAPDGKFITKYGKDAIDESINADSRLQLSCVEGRNYNRKQGGKNIKYRLGTVHNFCVNEKEDFFLMAFSKFDEKDQAFHTFESYVSCLMNLWREIGQLYALNPVVMPLLGSGITRFIDGEKTKQELLELIVWTFKQSQVNLKSPASLTIVLDESFKDDINLYKID